MKILIIEDEKKIADNLKKGLEQEGYIIDVSYDGISGFDLAQSEEFDLILLDLMLPGMSGEEICHSLRKDKNHIPILMLTAKSEIEDKVDGLNCGADDYLTKPFSFDELLARIKALLRRPSVITPNILLCGDLTLDTSSFLVKRGNHEILLSKKEFALLEYMIRNKNKTLTKEMIINNVWNFDSDILPNTVEVYIGYLRNKIDKPFKNNAELISTIRGFGYKISCPENKNPVIKDADV